jgi:hypothetical protein
MTSRDFTFWIKGYITAQHDSQIKLDIEKALEEVKDYDDNPDLEDEDGWSDWYQRANIDMPLTGSISSTNVSVSFISGSSSNTHTTKVWNDKMGAWHYTNYPDGFGYYINPDDKKLEDKKQKQQLND